MKSSTIREFTTKSNTIRKLGGKTSTSRHRANLRYKQWNVLLRCNQADRANLRRESMGQIVLVFVRGVDK